MKTTFPSAFRISYHWVAAIILLFLAGLANAQTITWTAGAAGGDWTTNGNWSGGAPVNGDDVFINTDQTSGIINNIPSGLSLNSLTINGNCTLVGAGNITMTTASLTVATGKSLTLGNAGNRFA